MNDDPKSDPEAAPDEKLNSLDLLHLRRGRFLDEYSQVENALGLLLFVYYDIGMDRRDHFYRLLSNLGAQQLIDAVAAVFPAGTFRNLLKRLRDLNTQRNLIAHGSLWPEWEDGAIEETLRWHHSMYKRTGSRREYVDAETLEKQTQDAVFMQTFLFLIADHIAEAGTAEGVEEVDWRDKGSEKIDADGVIHVSKALFDKIPTVGEEPPDEPEAPVGPNPSGGDAQP